MDAIQDNLEFIKKEKVSFVVRRGGLNQKKGLAHLESFLREHQIPHEIHGPNMSLGAVGTLVKNMYD